MSDRSFEDFLRACHQIGHQAIMEQVRPADPLLRSFRREWLGRLSPPERARARRVIDIHEFSMLADALGPDSPKRMKILLRRIEDHRVLPVSVLLDKKLLLARVQATFGLERSLAFTAKEIHRLIRHRSLTTADRRRTSAALERIQLLCRAERDRRKAGPDQESR
jgi:hypothetical protein